MINYVRQIFQRSYASQSRNDDNGTNVICPSCSNIQYADARFCNKCRYIL
ncbi:hypothetical protein DFR47_101778 [Pseudochrobactrum asaccharolyticum]|jgi:uncharacterized paraquat-inducible protein A|uniref:Zinc ribbon protein n=1 Tax=Pseudochrobactrum asaccharolyticum TaxID=354351 RepID=A0A366EA28_9HYPH|nr:hypothetical protein DFR47_101778 [Pseudochrobactrum asaccharolyticum]